jgi:hypothetical protein
MFARVIEPAGRGGVRGRLRRLVPACALAMNDGAKLRIFQAPAIGQSSKICFPELAGALAMQNAHADDRAHQLMTAAFSSPRPPTLLPQRDSFNSRAAPQDWRFGDWIPDRRSGLA